MRPRPADRGRAPFARPTLVGVAACLALLAPAVSPAQQWTADARVGRMEFRLAPSDVPAATTFALGLGFAEQDRRFHFTAGVPLGEQDPLWGALEVLERPSIDAGPVTLGIEAASQGFLQRYARSVDSPGGPLVPPGVTEEVSYGWGIAASVLPFVAVGRGAMRVEARAGGSHYRNGLGDRSASRTVALGDIRLIAAATPAVAFTAEARHFRAEDGSWTLASIGALAVIEGTELSGTVGHWLDGAAETIPWSAAVSTRLAERLDLLVEARQDALDPVYGSTPRRSWTAALRVRLAGPPAPAEPVPASYDGGTATIVLPASDAGSAPRIAGDFNDWTPAPMTARGDGWVWRGRLEPGVYQYAFVGADGEWFVPESVPGRVDDGMGGFVALLIIEEPGS